MTIKALDKASAEIVHRIAALRGKHQEHVQAGTISTVASSFAAKLAEAENELLQHLLASGQITAREVLEKFV